MPNLLKKMKKLNKKTKKMDKKLAKVIPKKKRKQLEKGDKFSKEYDNIYKINYKLDHVHIVGRGWAESYEFGNNYVNPFGTIKNASDVISGRQTLVEGVASEFTPYGDIKYARGYYERNRKLNKIKWFYFLFVVYYFNIS